MNIISQIVIGISCLFFLSSCGNIQKNKTPDISFNKADTLKIGYSDTLLIGKQLFPTELSEDLINDRVLLLFESNDYYYAFYNAKKENNFLSPQYWNQLTSKYIDFSIEDDLFSYTRFIKVDYYGGPFTTGFYNSKDSIITNKVDCEVFELQKKLNVYHLSTSDTLLKVNNNISVGKSLDDVLFELEIPNTFIQKKDFELVLMEATTQIDNVWYNDFPDYCSDSSVTVILSVKNRKISRIQYLDLEYIDYVFKQKSISTKDIHYH